DDSHEDGLKSFFKLAWEWRFYYRDAPTLYQLAPGLRERNMAVAQATHESSRRVLQRMVERGRLVASPAAVERLVINTWIVSTFWIEYLQSTQGVTRITRKHLDAGYAQVQALYWPYVPRPRT
ncbi:MAG: TetR family transcriptional regulator, partial [Cytophagales bacterium]|nr:TetR family transcriptional regulator [Rhizobacter sp.]